jgi:hypothetical protein
MFQKTSKQHQIVYVTTIASANTSKLFNTNKFNLGVRQLFDQDVNVQDMFAIMQTL